MEDNEEEIVAVAVEEKEGRIFAQQLYLEYMEEDAAAPAALEEVEIAFAAAPVVFQAMDIEEDRSPLSAAEIAMLVEYTDVVTLNASTKRSLADFDPRSYGFESSKRGRFTNDEEIRQRESAVFRRSLEVRRGCRWSRQKCRDLERKGRAVYLD